jgi:hypothetical protein
MCRSRKLVVVLSKFRILSRDALSYFEISVMACPYQRKYLSVCFFEIFVCMFLVVKTKFR